MSFPPWPGPREPFPASLFTIMQQPQQRQQQGPSTTVGVSFGTDKNLFVPPGSVPMSPFVTFSSPSAPDRPLFPTANEKDSPLMAWERELDRASASSATGTNTRGFATTFTPTSSPVDHYGGLHRVRLAERSGDDVATFMLSSLNGRKQLMEMDMKRRFALQRRPCELCGHPDGEYV